MGYTPSADVSQLLRLMCDTPAHEGDPSKRSLRWHCNVGAIFNSVNCLGIHVDGSEVVV